ncbi:DeoR family transcriptional regulator [Loigolactobacillus backii]|uniref:DeoR/GlpR family DNA-binding transcription regulator n=1 Tax=Loigolactobacillus backii TaxID=375175 RepID=UPI0007F0DC6B|nr:DeoR/GlpR family DNA-binding transcription regulator [Loigolactobacillus backii]ANK58893.1 DeoR family transcriptional regulator [Loigolactobacillus backii]ANK63883.1 DeoR family transcriptional regulator [Loigolactobacillus backii]ANK66330.1 DeoR family transcriptional regulator [Loigolactobacillus backii]OLF69318.1 DeoR family transcriptional regulator [Loigolactobacillus backii]PIO88471.1 DeoR family transcriptional regulator [Loigolactobacillus backii]
MPVKRTEQLLEIVNQRKKINVSELAQLLNVSKVTVRKDLTLLEQHGLLQRKHGFAIINNPDDLNYRLAQNYDTKRQIAVKAANLVHDNETIMIESGSTCALLAEELGKQGKHVTIVTISYFIANYVEKFANLDIFLLGGKYQANSQVVVGPLTKKALVDFHVAKLFIGTDGFDPKQGFFGNDIMRTDTVQAMAANAEQLIILTDSSKFSGPSLIRQFTLDEVSRVITDNQLPAATTTLLEQRQINVEKI